MICRSHQPCTVDGLRCLSARAIFAIPPNEAITDLVVITFCLRLVRKRVNVENVNALSDKVAMTGQTLGSKLIALKERSGLSLDNIAKAAGYSRASSVQRYFSEDYEVKWLPRALADRLIEALVGFGDPEISRHDIEYLTEYGFMMDRRLPLPLSPHMFQRAPRVELECNSTYPSGTYIGEAELFDVASDPLLIFNRPDHLIRRPIEAFFVSTFSMTPRHRPGDIVIVETERPATLGQDVFVSTSLGDSDGRQEGFLAVYVGRSKNDATFETLSPPAQIIVPLSQISAVSPILTTSELLAPKVT